MTLPIGAPREWNGQFEEALFLAVARRHRPGFPDKLATPPREPRNDDERAAVADYYTKMASHDLFIVQVVAKAIDTLFRDDPHFQLILSRQLGDDGAHAAIGRVRVTELTGRDPLPEVEQLVAAHAGWIPVSLPNALIGALAGYLSLWSIYWIFKLATGKEGMGYGDFKLLAALGAWLGWQMVLPVALFASLIGAVVGIALKLRGGLREGRYVPFGPFLAGGGLAVLLIGTAEVTAWLGLQAI